MKKLFVDCLLIALAALFLGATAFGQNRGSCPCKADGSPCLCSPASICPNCPVNFTALPSANASVAGPGGHWESRCNGTSCSWVWVQAANNSSAQFPVAKMPDAMAPKKLPAGDGPPALAFPMQTAEPPRARFSRLIHIRGFFHRLTHPRNCG